MLRSLASIVFLALVSNAAGQTAPKFDIADVHVSPRTDWVKNNSHALQGGFLLGDRFELHRATMLDLVRIAYNVDADKVFGGPSWLDYDRYEVIAKTKPGTRPAALRQMLQSLLEDRFKLTVKNDTREVPGYVLSKGKGELRLKHSDGSGAGSCQNQIITGDERVYTSIQCRNTTMEAFAAALRQYQGGPLNRLPVIDSTGLEGTWDADLPVRPAAAGGSQDSAVIDSVEKLGLKLELGKVPQPVLSIESVSEQPSANPPGIEAALPPLPDPEFEVASIRLPCNGNFTGSLRFETGGRVTAVCMPLMSLITDAYHLAPFERPLGVPKWLADGTTTAYNISIDAKAPANFAVEPQNNAQARDMLTSMLRSLLKDRYKLAVHYEDRPMDAYTLVAAKPKLTKGDPSNRTGCTRQTPAAAAGGIIDFGAGLQLKLVCQNMTMAQWAEQLQAYDLDIYYPVLDRTGLQGAWDFTLSYDAMAGVHLPIARGAGGPPAEASEPTGAVSFRDAIEKQLGLKLEVSKRPEPVLVIDHIEEKPTEN